MQNSILKTSIVRLVSAISNFLLVLIVAKYLGPTAKGEATLLHTTVSFVVFFCSLVGGQSFVYLFHRKNIFSMLYSAYLWAFVVCVVSFLFLSGFHFYSFTDRLFIVLISLLSSLLSVHSAVFLARNNIRLYNFFQTLPVLVTLASSLIFFFLLDLQSLLEYYYAVLLGVGLAFGLSLYVLFTYEKGAITKEERQFDFSLFKIGFGFQLVEFLQLLNLRFYFYLLLFIQNKTDLGYFSVGVSLFEVAWIFARSTQSIFYSSISSKLDVHTKVVLLNRFAKLAGLITFIVCMILYFLPDIVYHSLFGNYYVGINKSLKWYIPGVIVYNFYLVFQSYYLGLGQYRKLIIINAISFIGMVIAAFGWIPTYFFSGAAAAASISFMISSFLLTFDYLKSTQQSFQILLPEKEDWFFINSILKSIFKRV